MNLSGPGCFGFQSGSFVARVERNCDSSELSFRNIGATGPDRGPLRFEESGGDLLSGAVILPREMAYLAAGDLVRLNPAARNARVLYRRSSRHNFLFFTERCNSRCLMCSQPPRDVEDEYLVDDILRMIPWMDRNTPELGITGGEPTLVFEKLVKVIAATQRHLPVTALHLLTNGRLFSYLQYAQHVAGVGHPDLMVGIPVYADTAAQHDFVVQSEGAFDQTIFGLLNLARTNVRLELRIVVHRQTYARLPHLARFIVRNLPFVEQVVIMGLELAGYTRSNLEALWIEPDEYQDQLAECVATIDDAGIKVGIFNHQLCLLDPALHRFAQKSISDWKNIYLPECTSCALQSKCGGLFKSSLLRPPSRIRPLPIAPASE